MENIFLKKLLKMNILYQYIMKYKIILMINNFQTIYQKKYIKLVDGKKYIFSFELNLIKIANESHQINLLNIASINIKILTNEKKIETRDVFTFNQLKIIFEFLNIDIPFYSNKILTDQFIKELF